MEKAGTSGSRIVKDKLFAGGVFLMSMVTISPIVLIIYKLISKGYRQINFDFFSKKAPDTYEAMVAVNAGEIIPGGILNGITGTLFMVLIASAHSHTHWITNWYISCMIRKRKDTLVLSEMWWIFSREYPPLSWD